MSTTTPITAATAARRFESLQDRESLDEYNFEHFRPKHLAADAERTVRNRGILPGEPAPDFELPRSDGGTLRLGAVLDRPVLLHFGSSS